MKNKVGLLAYGETGFSALKGLISKFDVLWVIVPPEEIRKNQQDTSRVEKFAKVNKIPIFKTNSSREIFELVKKYKPDCVVISSYNKILSEDILQLTRFINIHHGKLPEYRGRANINWAIINGEKETAVTFHKVVFDLDSGNIYRQTKIPINFVDTIADVVEKVNSEIEKNVSVVVMKVLGGDKGKPQKGEGTYTATRLPQDGMIDWSMTTLQIYNFIRGLTYPYPGAFTYWKLKKLNIWSAEIPKAPKTYVGRIPGRVIAIHKEIGVEVLTGDSSIIIKETSYQNKNYNSWELIKSIKETLGISVPELMEKLDNKAKTS